MILPFNVRESRWIGPEQIADCSNSFIHNLSSGVISFAICIYSQITEKVLQYLPLKALFLTQKIPFLDKKYFHNFLSFRGNLDVGVSSKDEFLSRLFKELEMKMILKVEWNTYERKKQNNTAKNNSNQIWLKYYFCRMFHSILKGHFRPLFVFFRSFQTIFRI